ncbi:MAG: DUF4124 domain-containing protein [Pseudomonadota bacterium]|nr:DUF4124 domain-containing protein [Pseudomonadota bacterium]
MTSTLYARLLAGAALLSLATLAQAQYLWIDANGIKQLSDKAPPASVPLKNILKAPRGTPSAAGEELATATPAATPVTAAAPPTIADRNADYRKRSKAASEHELQERDAATGKADQADNCQRARTAKQSFDSGARISTQEQNGERGYMSDAQRALETRRLDRILAACK